MTKRNPIARSFRAGVNKPQVIQSRRTPRRTLKHRSREWERDFE